MHRTILGAGFWRLAAPGARAAMAAGLALALGAPAAPAWSARPPCPAATAPVQERFIPADCSACWQTPGGPGGPAPRAGAWLLDWISPAGAQADMAAAALPEAAERQARASASATATATATAPSPLPRWPAGWRLKVESGPAWNGYFGVAFQLQPGARSAALPAGANAWLALVEQVPAGSEGSPVARTLVRSLAGPLPLDARAATQHLTALRWPDTARPERLQARAWVEAADGRILAMAAEHCARR